MHGHGLGPKKIYMAPLYICRIERLNMHSRNAKSDLKGKKPPFGEILEVASLLLTDTSIS